jgi:phage terminase small subunit
MGNHNSGRRPQPTELKVFRGNPGKRRLFENEPIPPADAEVVKPEWLSPEAVRMWDEMAPVCLYMRTLTAADIRPFAALCELQATFIQTVKAKGKDKFDARLERETANAMRPYFEYFGMTPSSRARIQVPKKAEEPVSKWAGALK